MHGEEDFLRYGRSAVYGYALEEGVLRNVRRQPVGDAGQMPAVDLHDCQRVSVA